MSLKRILSLAAEILMVVLVFLLIIGPMMSLFIWSVAHRWYWPNTLPQEVGFEYWKQALGMRTSLAIGSISILPAFFLSLGIAVVVVIISMLIAIPAGYALAKYRIPFGAIIMFLFLMPNAFPQQPIFVNLLRIFTRLSLAGTVQGVILVHILVGLVFGVWITSATFRSIPGYLEEAAYSVGAGRLYTFFHITLPLAAPGLLASAVFVFITSLDEFTGTFFIGLPFVSTLPMTLYSSSGYNMQYASVIAIILLIPSILFMTLIQRVLRAEYVGGMG
jgi:ABC-type spermidine/putrescine transport system permease subunit II